LSKSDIQKAAEDIQKALNLGTRRALNRAASKANTQMVRAITSDTGLASAFVKKRVRLYKATADRLLASVNVATKVGVNLSEFKPKEVVVKVAPSNAKLSKRGKAKTQAYYGVTVKIGNAPRALVPGGFLRTVGSGKQLILARKGKGRYPTQALRTDVIEQSALANAGDVSAKLGDSFNDELQGQIDYALASRFSGTSDD
jgi:hypothetical protein